MWDFILSNSSSVNFRGAARISVAINDSDDDGFFDGTNFPIDSFRMFHGSEDYPEELIRAVSYFDPLEGRLVAETKKFSWWYPIANRWSKLFPVYYKIESLPENEFYTYDSMRQEIVDAFKIWTDALDGKFMQQKEILTMSNDIQQTPLIQQVIAQFNKKGISEEEVDKQIAEYFSGRIVDQDDHSKANNDHSSGVIDNDNTP